MSEPTADPVRNLGIASVKPVFVIGSYRSGTSVLSWALGQHANFFPLEETNWTYRQSVYIDRLYSLGTANGEHSNLTSMGINKLKFYQSFGQFINNFMLDNRINYLKKAVINNSKKYNLPIPDFADFSGIGDFAEFTEEKQQFAVVRGAEDPKNRWIDGTPENSHFVYSLNLMFPAAKFIFMIRNPIRVAHSLMNFASVGGATENYEEERAFNQWYTLTDSCYSALKAYGSKKILLVQQEDLLAEKASVIQNCLSFVNEAYDENCLKPLERTINSSQFDKSSVDYSIANGIRSDKEYIQRACLLYNQVLDDSPFEQSGSLMYYRLLRNKYLEHAQYFY